MKASVGLVVLLCLSAAQATEVNRRRTDGQSILARIEEKVWPAGAQAHVGNDAKEGDVLPLVVVKVFPDDAAAGTDMVNGQALLDGNDTLWVTSAKFDEAGTPGSWHFQTI